MANIIKRVWRQNKFVQIDDLKGMLFQAEQAGHTFEISGIDEDGNTIVLTGTPSGVLLRPDNTDVALTCSVSGGVVSATLPAECYDVPGRFGLTIFITNDNSKVAIYAAIGTISRTSSGTASPGTTQSVVDLINAINAAINSIPASYSNLLADIAPTYSDSALYAVGQYAWYDGDLKRCIVPITTSESYTDAHWTSAVLGQDVSDLKSALEYNDNIAIIDDWHNNALIATNGTTVDIRNIQPTSGYRCAVVSCSPGDVFTINGTGGGTPRLWCFIKANGDVIENAGGSETATNLIKYAPAESAYLVLNDSTNSYSYKGIITDLRIKEAEKHLQLTVNRGRHNNNILFNSIFVEGKYFLTTPIDGVSYSYYLVDVVAGKTYYFNKTARFVSKNVRNNQADSFVENQTSYTPTKNETIAITFLNSLKDIIVSESNIFTNIGGCDTPFFKEDTLAQETGNNNRLPISQDAFTKKIASYFGNTKNLVNPATMENGYLASYDTIVDSPSYKTTEYIKVNNGDKISFSPRIRMLAVYNEAKAGLEFIGETKVNYTYTITSNGYIRATYFSADEFIQAEIGENVTSYVPYGDTLKSSVLFGTINGNALYLKKYVACGDSFTEGEFTGDESNDHIFTEGLYTGKNKVYPYFIGRRNYMTVINEAVSGSSITYIDGHNREFSTPNGRYTQIPTDADYITLKFGINDCHAGVPIGSIDDNVNTTFYGAWNIVLSYLIEHYPYAKIGMIIGNGLNNAQDFPGETYAEAERLIAKKWGIPYLDEDKGEQIPLLLRTNKDYVCTEAKNMRNASFVVNPLSNAHPNAKAHEYESTIVENFMRSL